MLLITSEQDGELEGETSGQVINLPVEEYERKLLETTEQLSCAQDLLLFTTENSQKQHTSCLM